MTSLATTIITCEFCLFQDIPAVQFPNVGFPQHGHSQISYLMELYKDSGYQERFIPGVDSIAEDGEIYTLAKVTTGLYAAGIWRSFITTRK